MALEASPETRSAADYTDFLLSHLSPVSRLLDVGCGEGSITLGLAERVAYVVGVDPDENEFVEAQNYAAEHALDNVEFRAGSVYALEFADEEFDACLCHSVLETLVRPVDALREIARVLAPGGVLGTACVEYGGLVLAGPNEALLHRFYAIRERLWQLDGLADPYRGRTLRGLLTQAGFQRVTATSRYFSYGTEEAVRSFGIDRAEDCRNEWYASSAQAHGLATADDLDAMEGAWREWSESPDAYAAFAWCRAVAWKPAASGVS